MVVKWVFGVATTVFLSLMATFCYGATDIMVWTRMDRQAYEKLAEITDAFNAKQDDYRVILANWSRFDLALEAVLNGDDRQGVPDILEAQAIDSATLLAPKNLIYPLEALMKAQNIEFSRQNYWPAISRYYGDSQGAMVAFPLIIDTALAYYNLDMRDDVGLDRPPLRQTWHQFADEANYIVNRNGRAPCGFTTTWPSWINVESLSAYHNRALLSRDNGFAGADAKFESDNGLIKHHWQNLRDWRLKNIYSYSWRDGLGATAFFAGQCAMLVDSSLSATTLFKNANFNVGVGFMPWYETVVKEPQNSLIGGTALWVLSGRPQQHYSAIAQYLAYLASDAVQAKWSQQTGSIPATQTAFEENTKQGFYARHSSGLIAVQSISLHSPTPNSRGFRFGHYQPIRALFDEELEMVLTGRKTLKQALKDAELRANDQLGQFENHRH